MRNTRSTSRAAEPARLNLVTCEDRTVPAAGFRPVPDDAVAVAPDDGGIPRVRIVDPRTGEDVAEVQAFEDAFRGGVRVALGDVTGDGVRDIVIAPGRGGGPRVKVFDGQTGDILTDFFVYEPTFTGGLYVSLGDVNGDGMDDVITGTGDGGGPRVRVLDGGTLGAKVLRDFFAYEDRFRGGVVVSAGDVDGDGTADVITGTGVGGGPRVIAFSGTDDRVLRNFFAYEDSFRGGVLVSAGDVDGDGMDDILTGTGPGGGPVVRTVSGRDGRELVSFFADDSAFRGGVRMDAADANGDGRDDLVTRTRHGNQVEVHVFDGRTAAFMRTISRRVDDDPSPDDLTDDRGGDRVPAPGVAVKVEGTITAVDAAARRVSITLGNGQVVTFTVAAGAEVERNEVHTTLSAFQVGDRGEALIGPDGVAWKVEAEAPGFEDNDDNGVDDDGTIDQGPGDNGAPTGGDDSGGSNSGPGSGGQTETRVEGTITAVDAGAGTVTIRTAGGTTVVVRVGPQTKVERNDVHTTLAAFRVGDRGEARIGADGVATEVEAVGA